MHDDAIEFIKKRQVMEIYYKIIMIMIDDWKNEKNEKKKEQLKSEMMEYIDMFENAIQ